MIHLNGIPLLPAAVMPLRIPAPVTQAAVLTGAFLAPRIAAATPQVSRLWEEVSADRMINAMEWADRVAPWLVAGGLLAAGGFALSRLLPKFRSEWRGGEERPESTSLPSPAPPVFPVRPAEVSPPISPVQGHANGGGNGKIRVPLVVTPPPDQGVKLPGGITVPGYTIVKAIGAGGQGSVYEAVRPDLWGERFAVKIISPDKMQNEMARRRFEREVQSMIHLNHPNIVRIRYAGEVDGYLYMVLEYMAHGDLDGWHERNYPLAAVDFSTYVNELLRLMIGCLDGLGEMHRRKIIHRDIKPANIFLDEGGKAKLGDLGLARSSDGKLTTDREVVGSPPYMSLERLNGAEPDQRDDIYALGITLFETLTSFLPYGIKDSSSPEILRIYLEKMDRPVPDPSAYESRITPALAGIIMKAIARDPADRFQSATEMREAIKAFLEGRESVYEATVLSIRPLTTQEWTRPSLLRAVGQKS